MKKRIFWVTSSVLVIIICAVILLVVWLYPLLSSLDTNNASAALSALNRTAMDKVEQVDVFTGGQLERSVEGTDSIGRQLFVFQTGNQLFTEYKNQTISASQAKRIVEHGKLSIQAIISVEPGVFKLTASLKHSNNLRFVWEITAKLTNGDYLFSYLDLHTGHILYEFTTARTVNLSPQVSGKF